MAPGEGRIEVAVLGPLRVRDGDGRDITPSGGLQRRLLALLVLCRGEVVSTDAAVDVLWPGRPPGDAQGALQNHLSRLRRALPPGLIESVGAGYRLDPGRVEVDADRLASLVADPLDGAGRAEVTALLDAWHGPAYPELEDADGPRAEITRLAELRIRAREAVAEARLAADDRDGLVPDLLALADDAPLRERPRSLLMAALAADGRVADAIRAYDDFRRRLGDELGIEPSAALAAEHLALLHGEGPTPPTAAARRRLPVPATDLVGRDELVPELLAAITEGPVVTFLGPGGVGKTRLLVEVGHQLEQARPDRPVVLCELAGSEVTSALQVVAAALDIDLRPGVAPADRIADLLVDDELVLLLDNCEHVLDPVADLVGRLVTDCPAVTVVATSRERLRVPGEVVCPIPTLLAEGGVETAVDLFVRRARSVVRGFDPDPDDRDRIATVVQRLDGLPLAIELAAARLHTHDLAEVTAGLDRPLGLLTDGYRTAPRHASLAAVVEWSYGMLDGDLQELFAALSVFVRPFTAADAAAVAGLGVDVTTGRLAQLVERSLVVRTSGRYGLLETLRAYGAEVLAASGREEAARERHARWFTDWAVAQAARLHTDVATVGAIDAGIPEVQVAVTWSLDHGQVERAAHVVAGLLPYAFLRLRPDVFAWALPVLDAATDEPIQVLPVVWAAAGYHAWMAGDLAGLEEACARALELTQRSEADLTQEVATIRGNQDLFAGRLDDAAAWYRKGVDAAAEDGSRLIALGAHLLAHGYAGHPEAVELGAELLREVGDADTAIASYVWYCVGEADLAAGRPGARDRFARAVELADRSGASFVKGAAGASKASIDAREGDVAEAVAAYRWLIPHWQRAGMWSTQWTMLRSIAGLLQRLGRHREAAVLEGAVRSTASGHRIFGADEIALRSLGERLRSVLGDAGYEAALDAGGELDGHGAVELALRCLDEA